MNDRAGPAYRDEVAAAYARIESLEAEARARPLTLASAGSDDNETDRDRLVRLEAHARRWDRVRTTLALVLGLATLLTMHASERFGASVAVLVSSIAMVAVGVTLAWPSLSMRAALGARSRAAQPPTKSDKGTGVRVAQLTVEGPAPSSRASAPLDDSQGDSQDQRPQASKAGRERAR